MQQLSEDRERRAQSQGHSQVRSRAGDAATNTGEGRKEDLVFRGVLGRRRWLQGTCPSFPKAAPNSTWPRGITVIS